MPESEPMYTQASEFNWLDLVSENRAQIDPRTYEVHQIGWTPSSWASSWTYRWTRKLTRRNLDMLDGRRVWPFMTKWVEETVIITTSEGYDPVPEDDNDYIETESYYDSEPDSDIDEVMSEPLQLEAVPPYSKPSPKNTLFQTHLQTRGQSSYHNMEVLSSYPSTGPENYLPSQVDFDATTVAISSPSSTLPAENYEELNIGKLIAGKFKEAWAHGMETCRSLQGKVKL
ncbi:hypothetical protein N7456_007842 [Penicillium angulare]|uniref:Uncharacterized protein n=1 Tax=Penicillium angulare TaxID=116970 RepID=A0A9W9FBL3_9EURO|nr:hypothetical protein N7456_007842 [Penicillium angulare]